MPREIKKFLQSQEIVDKFGVIEEKFSLNTRQAEALENEVIFVMLGFEHPTILVRNIQPSLKISEERAKTIGQEINTQIFRPIRESLKKIHGITDQQPTTDDLQQTESDQRLTTNDLQQKSEVEIRNYELGNVQKTTASSTNYKLPSTISQVTPAPFPSANGAETDLSQEKILKDIETPAGGGFTTSELQSVESEGQDGGQVSEASHPASSADMLHSFTASKDKQPGTDFLEDKLTTISKLPKAEYEHIEEAPKKSLSSKTYNADPYREAVE